MKVAVRRKYTVQDILIVACYNADGSRQFNGYWDNKEAYVLAEMDKNIYVFDAGNKTYWEPKVSINPDVINLVTSPDEYFGNSSNESANAYPLLYALSQIYDYYDEKFSERGCGVVTGICNDTMGSDNGENAGGTYGDISALLGRNLPGYDASLSNGQTGWITVGSTYCNDLPRHMDILAHEYTHYISRYRIGWVNVNQETGAINEGLSDLFGEIIAASCGNELDWIHGSRNMINPAGNGYPAKVTDSNHGGEDYSHGYSTVITHAAYLMWNGIDDTDSKKISTNNLAELWYRAMLMMPADCDFNTCRRIVELAASSMKLTSKQIACVREAFEKVGVTGELAESYSETYTVSTGGTLCVYSGKVKYTEITH